MASAKRKALDDERPSKKPKSSLGEKNPSRSRDASDEKKPKLTVGEKKSPQKSRDAGHEKKLTTSASLLQHEERAFPRGGGSVLTPIEHKQIQVQAHRDALLEHETGQAGPAHDDDEDLFDERAIASNKKRKSVKSHDVKGSEKEASKIKIQGLSYKNLVAGSCILGRITAITRDDIAVALPNNLTGFVRITGVSDTLNSRLEDIADTPNEDEATDIELKDMFVVGQWLKAIVTSVGADSAANPGASKRHIELSLNPAMVNGGLRADEIVANSVVQASVKSVEDHGVIMDHGLPDADVKGFISKKDLGEAFDAEKLQDGQVMMCLVTGKGSNEKVLKLSPKPSVFAAPGSDKKAPLLTESPTVDGFQAGTAVQALVVEAGIGGIVCKLMGMLDVTADTLHSAPLAGTDDIKKQFKVGSKVNARIIWSIPQNDGSRLVGISFLDHIVSLVTTTNQLPRVASASTRLQASKLQQKLPTSATVENCKVVRVITDRGLYLTIPNPASEAELLTGYAHISQISDERITSLSASSGAYRIDSIHSARVMSYNPIDDVYYMSMKPSILKETFLRIEDVTVGTIAKGTIEKIMVGGTNGIKGVLVKLSNHITGLVPEMHLSDVHLQHPERKFREGLPVTVRVLSADLEKRQLRLTCKKSLVDENDESAIWKDYRNLSPGMRANGTIVNILPKGAAVQFYGGVRAWLSVAEMSETFIENPETYFRIGQTVNVRILAVDAQDQSMKVSCKDGAEQDPEQQATWNSISGGEIINGTVAEKAAESLTIDLENGLRGILRIGHLLDGSLAKAEGALNRIRLGQKLSNLLVLDKTPRSQSLILSNKDSMINDAKAGNLVISYHSLSLGRKVYGFVRNITPDGVFVEFANGVVGLYPKSQIPAEQKSLPEFGLRKDQSIGLWIIFVDTARDRFTLSVKQPDTSSKTESALKTDAFDPVSNPVDSSIKGMSDFSLGRVTKARIASIKGTQINVRLADGVQGRIDISEAFNSWDEFSNKSSPLQNFKQEELLEVKILGIHDARSHRFLPISHRRGKNPVFELTAKKSRVESGDTSLLSLDTVKPGTEHIAFVNNHSDDCLWVNLSPNVRGRIALIDLSDDVSLLQDVEKKYQAGRALQVTVKSVDMASNRLDLSARHTKGNSAYTLSDLSAGMVIPGRVTKVNQRGLTVQISDAVAAPVPLVELSDDFDHVNLAQHEKNDIVRVCVLNVDLPNKRLFLTMRPSKVLSSSLPVKDQHLTDPGQIKPGTLARGFIKHIGDKGVVVSLGATVDAFVRVADLSDQYIKDWRSIYEIDQLVQGRIQNVEGKNVHMTLKASLVDGEYVQPLSINDLEVGMIVTGRVRKVEDFGAFIDIDNTKPRLSGLCHRSEVAAKRVEDVRQLYTAGDIVKAKILNVDVENRKISLGLKAAYFSDQADDGNDEDEDSVTDDAAPGVVESDDDENSEYGFDGADGVAIDEMDVDVADSDDRIILAASGNGLRVGGFDWNATSMDVDHSGTVSDHEEDSTSKKRKRKNQVIQNDVTGDLDKFGPRSVSDFERQLLGQPNNSGLWIQYMAFELQLNEVQKARDIAERALRTIHIREMDEKANIWIALLNLEAEYGDDEKVEETFKKACQVQEPLGMHEKLASIYIDSGKHDKADDVFSKIVSNKNFRASPEVWLNYATFLLNSSKAPDRARALLSRALQSVPSNEHRLLTAKFAALEFRSSQGDAERGRTIFEGLVAEWPKWSSGWDMWADLERSQITTVESEESKVDAREKTRVLFERMAAQKMKKRRAKFVFKKWLEFEEKEGTERQTDRVKKLAQEYVEKLAASGDDDAE